MKNYLFVVVFVSTLIIPALGQEKEWTWGNSGRNNWVNVF